MAHPRMSPLFSRQRPAYRSLIYLFSTLLLVFVMAACGSGGGGNANQSSSSGPKTGGELKVGLVEGVVTLDPLKSTALVDREVMLNMYDTLVTANNKNEIEPDLATSWKLTNPTTMEFTLRSGVKFADGTPFNAQAVADNINRILNTPSSPRHSEISAVTSVQVVDDTHIDFNLKQPFAPLLAALTDRAGMILSPAILKSDTEQQIANGVAGAGSGPFMFSSWVKGDHLTLARNPNYWQKDSAGKALPYLDKVTYKPITNGSVRYNNLQTGTINVAQSLDPTDVASAKSNSSLIYKQIPGLSFYGLMLNTKAAPFNDVHARHAVAWGVNREEIVKSVFKDTAVVAQGPISPSSWAFDKTFQPFTYDVTKAKSELSQSSSPSGFSFTLLIGGGSPLQTQEAQFIQSELQAVGITVNIKQETFAKILSDTESYNFQAALLGWSGRPDPDGNMYGWFHTGGGFNSMQYSNPQVDKFLEDARTSSIQSQRISDYQQAQKQIVDDASYIFIEHGGAPQASTANVHNFPLAPTTIMIFTNTYLS